MPLEVKQIEDIVDQMAAAGFWVILQHLEIRRSLIIHHHDFAVQNRLKSAFLQRLGNRDKPLIEGDSIAAVKGDLAGLDFGQGPVTIPFHLKKPFRMVKRFFNQGRQHRFEAVRQRFERGLLQVGAFQGLMQTNLLQLAWPVKASPGWLRQSPPGSGGTLRNGYR